MEEEHLDYVLVPLGLSVMAMYHSWLLITILANPRRTVIGLNAESRHQWVFSMMADPLKNGVLAVQTIRNNIMASTLLATTAITLSSLISVFVSSTSNSGNTASQLVYGNTTPLISSIKYFSILLCFLVAFLCNVQSIRYYAHVSFLVTVPASKDKKDSIEYVARNLNRGSFFWSLGLRAFYLSFPLFLWIFGPIPMFVCCCIISFILYFLDTTTSFTRQLHTHSFREEIKPDDVEAVGQSISWSNCYWSLGLRAFYLSFPRFLWIFGPIPMFVCCCIISFILYFLDTTTSFTRQLHTHSFREEIKPDDVEAVGQSMRSTL